nr:glycosyltransferase [Paracoccaceae bacterium]
MFAAAGLAGVAKRDAGRPLGLDNLRGLAAAPRRGGPKVTVIMPLYNAAGTVETALASLMAQTHADLEALCVDDASTDDGPARVEAFAAGDPRVRLIRQDANAGAYAARNRGLAEATGAFVTVHDADDWSHPEKIARHLADLRRGRAPFNISAWVRATPELVFLGGWRPAADLVERNFSSVFLPRTLLERLGPWDDARLSADRELACRLQRVFGLPRQAAFLATPLAFGRSEPGSLTRTGPTHVATMYHGLRREYFEASDFWHARLDPAALRKGGLAARPPYFPAPPALRPDRHAPAHDLLFIGDFNFLGGTQKSALAMIAAARAAGLDAALMQYRRVDQDVTQPLNAAVRAMAWAAGVRIVAPGERLRATTVVVTYPPVFDTALDRFPQVEHERLAVAVNQMAERDLERTDVAYAPARVRANLAALIGSEGIWAPISARVRALMAADDRYPRPFADTWTPLLDTSRWCAREPVWRGGAGRFERGRRPVIGRHGRDHPLKWPREPASLCAAYCAGRPCDVRFLGGAVHARARLTAWPANWRDEAFDARDVASFLAGLDVFLHYPDPRYIEEFGRAPMEAMAVGVPVILPPEFEPTFGAAALYAPPEGVWPLVARLWEDRGFWEDRVAAGRAFVAENCAYAVFPARLARLAAADGAPRPMAAAAAP